VAEQASERRDWRVLCETDRTMLIELWEKLQGYDKWKTTEAKVIAASVEKGEMGEKVICRISWVDSAGKQQEARFEADEESPLFQLSEGDPFAIRFNEKSPSDFYARELIASDALAARKAILWAIVMLLMVVAWFLPDLVMVFSKH